MTEASTIKFSANTLFITAKNDGVIDLAPLGVSAGQKFAVGDLGEGFIVLMPVKEDLRDSDAWQRELDIVIIDPDGWDRANYAASWSELITREEFLRRADRSTQTNRAGAASFGIRVD